MTLRLILPLLLGLAVTSGAAASLCVLSENKAQCVCNVMDIQNPENQICQVASELELRDGKLDLSELVIIYPEFAFQLVQKNKVIFKNVTISFSLIGVLNSTLWAGVHPANIQQPLFLQHLASQIKALQMEDITVDPSFLQPSLQGLHHWLFASLKSFGLVRSGLVEIDCDWAQRVENLTHLDLSENPISYTSLQDISRCSSLSFKYLKSLHLRSSNLTSLQSLCTPLSLTPALAQLDVSGNNFPIFHYPRCLQMKPLRMLNLSHSGITEVNSLLSASLEELDLSYNSLEVFDNPPQTLKKLYLSNNRLVRLPSLDKQLQLQELKVDGNRLTILINETGVSLSSLEQLVILRAGRNPYRCDCDLKETVIFLDTTLVSVEDYPEEFLCATPAAQQGAQITSVETCVKPNSGTRLHGPPLCLTLFTGLLSHLIYFC